MVWINNIIIICCVGWSEDLLVEAFEANQQEALNKAGISAADMSECTINLLERHTRMKWDDAFIVLGDINVFV